MRCDHISAFVGRRGTGATGVGAQCTSCDHIFHIGERPNTRATSKNTVITNGDLAYKARSSSTAR